MAQKFGSAISGSLVAILLGIAGFISGSDPATGETIITITDQEAVKEMIWMLFSIIPAFIVLIMMFLLHKYPIKK
jgi:GPH family glycoside/pentoside/hexuronide:cation symporter